MRHALNVSIPGASLAQALACVAPATNAKGLAHAQAVKLHAARGGYLTLTAGHQTGDRSSFHIAIQATIRAQVAEQGEAIVMHRLITDTIATIAPMPLREHRVVITQPRRRSATSDEEIGLACGKAKTNMAVLPLADFQEPPKVVGVHYSQTLAAAILCKALEMAVGATSKETDRPVLQNVALRMNRLLGADGFQLADVQIPVRHYKDTVMWHRDCILALCKAVKTACKGKSLAASDIEINVGDSVTAFYVTPYQDPKRPCPVISLAVFITNEEGRYPDTDQIQKKTPYLTTFTADRKALLETLAPLVPFAREASQVVKMNVNGRLDFAACASHVGDVAAYLDTDSGLISKDGPDNHTAFNAKMMTAAIKGLTDKEVRIGFDNPTGVIGVWNGTAAVTEKPSALVMPMHISQ